MGATHWRQVGLDFLPSPYDLSWASPPTPKPSPICLLHTHFLEGRESIQGA